MLKKIFYLVLVSCLFAVATVYADKPDKGKDKAVKEHVKKDSKHKYKNDAGEKLDKADIKDKDISGQKDHDDKVKGLEKQKDKKAEQEQKELEKGSEQGQASREEHRRKWWKFWESEEN